MTVAMRMVVLACGLGMLAACGGASQPMANLDNGDKSTAGYTVGGTVAGLSGNGLVLEMNGGSDLTIEANGAFAFPGSLVSGASYSISIKHQPAERHEICTVTNGSGVVGTDNISDASINCTIAVGFAYVMDENSQIAAYGIAPGTGALIPDGSVPIPAGGYLPLVVTMVPAPGGKFLYVLSQLPNQISTFAVDPNQGGLTPINTPLATDSGPVRMVMSSNGSFLFVYNIAVSNTQTIHTFKVDSVSGALTASGTVLLQNTGCAPGVCPGAGDFAVRSDSKYLYALTYNGANDTTSVTPFAIDSVTGGLTGGTAITFPTNAAGTSISIDPLGRFLYVAEAVSPDGIPDQTSQSATVVSYNLDPMTGALAPASSSVVANGASLMAPDPTGAFLYAIYSGCCAFYSNIIALSVDPSTGALSQVGSSIPIGTGPSYAACDPSGTFLFLDNGGAAIFTASQDWNDLSSFTIATDGVNTGALSMSGQGAQFKAGTASSGVGLAIIE